MIDDYVKKIPEIYQTIYGFPEYTTSRDCTDREKYILNVIDKWQKVNGRPAKVLDIGCAQGYYCFKAAELGADVTGVDFNAENITLCKMLAQHHKKDITFVCEGVGLTFVSNLDRYDIIIALSVFHHIAMSGYYLAKDMFETICKKADIVIAEMAVKQEHVYWNKTLPEDYEDWFTASLFYKEMAYMPTHLSEVKRPLIFSSNKYLLCNDDLYRFTSMQTKSYPDGLNLFYKRLYFYEDNIYKLARKSKVNISHSEYMYNEVCNEINILLKYDFAWLPELYDFELQDNYVISVTGINKGELLYGKDIKLSYLLDVLDNLIELQNAELYHNDIRPWNIVVKDGKAFLIDAGAIIDKDIDCSGISTIGAFLKLLTNCYQGKVDITSFKTIKKSLEKVNG